VPFPSVQFLPLNFWLASRFFVPRCGWVGSFTSVELKQDVEIMPIFSCVGCVSPLGEGSLPIPASTHFPGQTNQLLQFSVHISHAYGIYQANSMYRLVLLYYLLVTCRSEIRTHNHHRHHCHHLSRQKACYPPWLY
jgi:hypothetical protein